MRTVEFLTKPIDTSALRKPCVQRLRIMRKPRDGGRTLPLLLNLQSPNSVKSSASAANGNDKPDWQ